MGNRKPHARCNDSDRASSRCTVKRLQENRADLRPDTQTATGKKFKEPIYEMEENKGKEEDTGSWVVGTSRPDSEGIERAPYESSSNDCESK